ncbi:type II secretion system minor pseudopilin GspK [Psychromonas sp. Urea-02u-13]|uniref:type II secretion system minor pseudopilin GspK n=1 Tax=Psychromonas sp. Urea-02u-13 TaxID=2058326 RepID=UPI000C32249F|nr:type II secretion system minor pseudopilin GspK [Psychromonas sp. Urea-02u-13]PKG40074.1 general secretion pathway protein GspK [Psychromonas sp. Urea-02u-13]
MMLNSPQKQRGIALITVLMILAIMVTIASTMTGRLTLSLKRTEGLIFSQSVYWYGQAAGDFGRMVLNQDFADSDVVSLDQNWALPEMVFPLENGSITGEFKDLRSCFNLNALGVKDKGTIRATPVTQFQALLEGIGINDYAAEMIAESARDWVDKDDQSNAAQGAEDSIYQARSVPHLAGNNLMVDVSELRAVQGVGQKVYDRIAPYLCAIPTVDQKININTVKVEQAAVLYALFERDFNLALSDFTKVLEDRPVSGWNNVDDFLALSIFSESKPSAEIKAQLSVSSEYFQLNGKAEFEDRIIAVQLLFQMDEKKAKVIRYQSGGLK